MNQAQGGHIRREVESLTLVCLAPAKSKAQKMSIGTFLADESEFEPPGGVLERRGRWRDVGSLVANGHDNQPTAPGPMRWRIILFHVSAYHPCMCYDHR